MKMIKADFHVHSNYSGDSVNTCEIIIEQAKKKNLGCIAVCDHGNVNGSVALNKMELTCKIIISEEIKTNEGEIIGLFLKETIPNFMSPEDTIKAIREQNGIVCIPHPFDPYRGSAMQEETLERIHDLIDIVEVRNSRTIPFQKMERPLEFAQKYAKLQSGGSDAHVPNEIGRTYVEMPDFTGRDDFLEALSHGTVHYSASNPVQTVLGLPMRPIRKFLRKKALKNHYDPK